MLLLVRHADAGVKGSWDGPDALRPLSPMGRRQAEGLVVRLEDYPVDRILCSPTARCHQTVQLLPRFAIDGLAAAAPLQWPKGSTWLLERTNPPEVRARYLAPLALGGRVEIG